MLHPCAGPQVQMFVIWALVGNTGGGASLRTGEGLLMGDTQWENSRGYAVLQRASHDKLAC